jgi:hypothetical protein
MTTTQRTSRKLGRIEKLELKDAVADTLDEARMVLPGIQALFGFQLVAVFNASFSDKLSPELQSLHYGAIVLTVLCAALVMAPAAYDRLNNPMTVSEWFIEYASWLITFGMVPLMLSISIDVFIIGMLVLKNPVPSAAVALACAAAMTLLWFILPKVIGALDR